MKRAVVLNAHADDGISAGGTISKLIEKDYEVFYVVFSIAEASVPPGFKEDIVEEECLESLEMLGVKSHDIHHYPVRRLNEYRQDILEYLVGKKKEIQPDVVFLPSTYDIHQDHIVVCNEGIRAFRRQCSLYGFDNPWNTFQNHLNKFEVITEKELRAKIRAAQCYRSQLVKSNNCLTEEYLKAQAIERGNRINVPYAEAFEVIQEISR